MPRITGHEDDDYDVDEEAIIVGTKAMANVLVNYLEKEPNP